MFGRSVILLLAMLTVSAGCGRSVATGSGSPAARESALFCREVNSTVPQHGSAHFFDWNPKYRLEEQLHAAIKTSPVQKLHTELAQWDSEVKNFETDEATGRLTPSQRTPELITISNPPPMVGTCRQIGDGLANG